MDFGLKRVGLAVTDPGGAMAFPLVTLTRGTRQALFAELVDVVAREGVEAVVVGWPAPAPGRDSLVARQCENFARSLARRVEVPVSLMDETLSSAVAEDDLRQAGVRTSRLGPALDQQAAVRILESYLADPAAARDVRV
ncbi:Holliday junction resolvase RuvX [Fundidesulfovibrio butyratiphilus]